MWLISMFGGMRSALMPSSFFISGLTGIDLAFLLNTPPPLEISLVS